MNIRKQITGICILLSLCSVWLAGSLLLHVEYKTGLKENAGRIMETASEYRGDGFFLPSGIELLVKKNGKIVFQTDDANYIQILEYDGELDYRCELEIEGQNIEIYKMAPYSYLAVGIVENVSEEYSIWYAGDISRFYGEFQKQRIIYMILMIGLSFGIIIFSDIAARTIVKPIEELKAKVMTWEESRNKEEKSVSKNELEFLHVNFCNLNEELSEKEKQLLEEVKEREAFIDNLTHEMATPLTSIYGYADLLLRRMETEDDIEIQSLKTIMNEASRLSNMRDDLYTLLVVRNYCIENQKINMQETVSDICRSLQFMINEYNNKLNIDVEEANIFLDRKLLEIYFSNILRNAIQYAPDSRIDVLGYAKPDEYVLEVKDCGCGIDEKDLSHLCEPFYRVDKSRSRSSGGTGLGLTLCSKIVEILEAEFTIESILGVGTTVKLRIGGKHYEKENT